MPRYAIASHSGLYYAGDDGRCTKISAGYFYGTVLMPSGDAVLTIRRIDPWSKTSKAVAEIYDLDGSRLFGPGPDLTAVRDPHQALYADGGIYITDACHDRLHYFPDSVGLEAESWDFPGEPRYTAPNSIRQTASGRLLIAFHNRGAVPSNVIQIERREEEIAIIGEMDLPDDGIHNVLALDGCLYYNASDSGEIVRMDLDDPSSAKRLYFDDIDLHTKGMAVDGDRRRLVCGASDREVTLDQRFVSRSWLAFIDLPTFEPLDLRPLICGDGSAIGNVNEIVRLPEAGG